MPQKSFGDRARGAFFSGDTGLADQYAAIRERLEPFDLVMLEALTWPKAMPFPLD
jgi:hypothetical protein